jgi:hypothetical protein
MLGGEYLCLRFESSLLQPFFNNASFFSWPQPQIVEPIDGDVVIFVNFDVFEEVNFVLIWQYELEANPAPLMSNKCLKTTGSGNTCFEILKELALLAKKATKD